MRLIIFFTVCLYSCSSGSTKESSSQSFSQTQIKEQFRLLEYKWLQSEFALDTASIAPMLDSTFVSISATGTSNKQMELEGIYKNISTMQRDSIFIDSFKIEEPFFVNHFNNTAIAIFICHTYKTAKGKHEEKRTKFYDVWRKADGEWKAMSSQGTTVQEIK